MDAIGPDIAAAEFAMLAKVGLARMKRLELANVLPMQHLFGRKRILGGNLEKSKKYVAAYEMNTYAVPELKLWRISRAVIHVTARASN